MAELSNAPGGVGHWMSGDIHLMRIQGPPNAAGHRGSPAAGRVGLGPVLCSQPSSAQERESLEWAQ